MTEAEQADVGWSSHDTVLRPIVLVTTLPFPVGLVWDWTTDLRNMNAICAPFFGFRYDQSMPPWLKPGFVLPIQNTALSIPISIHEMRVVVWQPQQRVVVEGWTETQRAWQHTLTYRASRDGTLYGDLLVIDSGYTKPLTAAALALFVRYRQRNLRRMICLDY